MVTLKSTVKLHCEKCCESCNLLVISGVWTRNTLCTSISANYWRHWDLVDCESQPTTLVNCKITASNQHCWLRMPLVCNSILPVTIVITMYTKIKWLHLFSKHNIKLCLSVSVFIVDITPLPTDDTLNLEVSQSRLRWNEQPKTLLKTKQWGWRYTPPLPLMEKFSYTIGSSIDCVI